MDALAGLLDGPRASGAFLLRCILDPPWSLRIRDEAPLTVIVMMRGSAWVVPDTGEPVRVHEGDLAIVRGPEPYTVADDVTTPPRVFIDPGQRCVNDQGEDVALAMNLGVRTWGNSPDGATVMLTGVYQMRGEVSQRLLAALPQILVSPPDSRHAPLVHLLAAEMAGDEPGQPAVLDRLLDLLLVAVLRTWFSRPEAQAPGWYQAHGDPVVGKALRLIHNNPDHPWTVAALASATGVSRAGFARRFTDLVSEPPMTYLTRWRLAMAADLLREPDATITSVARRVGYGSPYALSTAFKRERGHSPRARELAGGRYLAGEHS